jgi:hypothetical protein
VQISSWSLPSQIFCFAHISVSVSIIIQPLSRRSYIYLKGAGRGTHIDYFISHWTNIMRNLSSSTPLLFRRISLWLSSNGYHVKSHRIRPSKEEEGSQYILYNRFQPFYSMLTSDCAHASHLNHLFLFCETDSPSSSLKNEDEFSTEAIWDAPSTTLSNLGL